MKPRFFATPRAWRAWLQQHHAEAGELWVGFHRKDTGTPSITWPESVDEALCFGWIDGLRKRLDESSYVIRFTPRRPTSVWSAVNIRRVGELTREGRMTPAGLRAFAHRRPGKSAIYSYEQRHTAELDPASERRFRAARGAWGYFAAQPDGYRRNAIRWVMSAKQEATRERRLATLIDDSAHQRRIAPLRRPGEGVSRARRG